jgi:NADH dehydrogenase
MSHATEKEHQESGPHVVVIGGGFGGLYAARALANAPVRVTLVDRKNHHLFQPLLYQVATAGLNPSDIAAPIRRVLRHQANARVELATVTKIDTVAKRVLLEDGELAYDYLVVATGATHSYFAHPEWEAHAPGLKSVEDALEIRRRVLFAFEEAEREPDPEKQRAWLTFVVVGGGATGVELAGALAELSHHVLVKDFRRIEPARARIMLVEGGPRVLPAFLPSLSEDATETLEHMGVTVRVSTRVERIDAEGVIFDGERVPSRTVLWAAGVKGSPLAESLGVPLDKSGRVVVEGDLSVPGAPDVFVIGDLAHMTEGDKQVPGVAPAAMQGGVHAAKMITRKVHGLPTTAFHYLDKGSLATIGRAAAVAEMRGIGMTGFVAWLAWLALHLFFLIGFRNRVLVLLEWGWAYLAYDRGARVITQPWLASGTPHGPAATQTLVAPPPSEPEGPQVERIHLLHGQEAESDARHRRETRASEPRRERG